MNNENYIGDKPTLDNYWRAILLLGRNTASYKFSLAKTLLNLSKKESSIKVEDIAIPFALNICDHLKKNKKQHTGLSNSFLSDCTKFIEKKINSEQLKDSSIKNGFNYVLDAFHNVAGSTMPLFYENLKNKKKILLTDNYYRLLENNYRYDLDFEIQSRWEVWENGITEKINPRFLQYRVNKESENLDCFIDKKRRIDTHSLRPHLNIHQKGKCFYCFAKITIEKGFNNSCEVDHYFPHKLKDFGFFNVDQVWNLVLSCINCNRGTSGKSLKIPNKKYLKILNKRNNWYIKSYRNIGYTIMKQTGENEKDRIKFLETFDTNAFKNIPVRWEASEYMGAGL